MTSRYFIRLMTQSKVVRRCFHASHGINTKSAETELVRQLRTKIRLTGPITVAEYMKEVLTHPTAGYYMMRDVFGSKGDFITSPEISQMFGECIGIWCVNEWIQSGSPGKVQIVELGPGRGTLADDMLRVFSKFPSIKDAVSMHFVEVSPKLSEMQEEKLSSSQHQPATSASSSVPGDAGGSSCTQATQDKKEASIAKRYKHCHSKYGCDVSWYAHLCDVPKEFSIFIAHEFLDALPIHKFQHRDGAWHEVMVDVDDLPTGPHHFKLVLSKATTAASKLLLKVDDADPRDHIELCPAAGVLAEELAQRVAEYGGAALIADYGHSGEKTDTFRAFKEHQLFEPLCEPGTADLTADVDFAYLRNIVGDRVSTYGPTSQHNFLHNMGIGVRLKVLMGTADTEQRKNLITGYDMLTNPEKMGERFKFFALMQHREEDYQPAGFASLQ